MLTLTTLLALSANSTVSRIAAAKRNHHQNPRSEEEEEPLDRAAWNLCHNASMVPFPAANLAYHAVQHVDATRVAGAIVEAGVYRGGMSCYMAMAHLESHFERARHLWLFDTFEGMPPPTEKDDAKSKRLYAQLVDKKTAAGDRFVENGKWCYGSLDDVKSTMGRTHYKQAAKGNYVHFVVGKVEDTLLAGKLPASIAILRLDTDWYESTRVELELLWPRLSPGGWLYLDDYKAWGGAKRAMNEWLHRNGWWQKAIDAGAFPQTSNAGRFAVWKNTNYSASEPFMPAPAAASPRLLAAVR